MNVIIWCAFLILTFVTTAKSSNLQPGGVNVETKYETYQTRVTTTKKSSKQVQTCRQTCTWLGWPCWTTCRSKTVYFWVTGYKTVTKQRAVYQCKSGWKQDGNECTIPICKRGCQNNGRCTAPDFCTCTPQWNGTDCSQDVNECDPNSGIRHGCQETCVNFRGGYNCTCQPGHFLASNGKNCTDHDECAGNIHGCQQGCINYPGGYNCICRPGYTLNINDSKTCDGHQCEKILSPINGAMECTGNTTDHSCKFSCSPGYELRGSSNRSCNASGNWTGDETLCEIIHCPKALPPQHGFVYTPCATEFSSECIVGCMRGYFMKGNGIITCNASGIWQPQVLSCTKRTACERNPCRHNSVCIPLSSSRYICDCSNTGYRGINCHIGYITTPKYPRITTKNQSSSLQFQSSPLISGHVVLTPSSGDVIFTPPYLLFNSTSSHQFLTIASEKPGIHFIKYSISGPNAVEFNPPGDDIFFVDVIKNSTNQTTGNSTTNLELPIGCHQLALKNCGASDEVIISSSTASWETTGAVTSSSGIIMMHAGKTNIPLSLFGTSLASKTRSPDEKQCDVNQSYSVEQLTRNHVLTKSFLGALKDSFPKWLTVKVRRGISEKSFYFSDIYTQFLSGKELRQTLGGKGQPIADNSSFLVLHSSNVNLTVENDNNILKKSRGEKSQISLAVDVCSDTPKTIIIRVPDEYAKLIQNSLVFKRLKQNGWELTIYSIQISKTNSILTYFGEKRFWDGEKLINKNIGMKGNLALLAKVKKSFTGQKINSYLEFYGTMVISVGKVDNILTSPLDQEWLVNLYGNMALTIQLTVEGKKTNLTFNAAESINFATFGGNLQEQSTPQGLYISHYFETSPFINSDLDQFVEISSKAGIAAFFKTKLQSKLAKNDTKLTSDRMEAVHIAFHGDLKFGQLRFEDVAITLRAQSKESTNDNTEGIILRGRTRRNTTQNYGIFKSSNLDVNVHISSEDKRKSTGSFESNVELLGFKDLVNVTFGIDGLRFNTTGKVHGLYTVDLSCVSSLASWQSQIFLALGEFRSGEGSLTDSLSVTLRDYALHVYNTALKRATVFKGREQRAKNRLESILYVLEAKKQELNKSQIEYNISKKNLEAAEARFRNLQNNVSQRLDRLKADLNKFCPEVKQCPNICQAGVVCRNCKYNVVGKSKKTCLSTCYKTETRRIKTNSTFVPCKRQHCIRVFVKDGIIKTTLQKNLTRVRNDIFSFGRKASTRSQSQDDLSTDEVGGPFPGTKKQDVCQYAEITGNILPEKLCETDDRNGHWDCSTQTESCSTPGFRYEKYHAPYTCERPCEVNVINESIPKSCCETVACAFKSVNRTCVAQNHFCNRIRIDALEKLAANISSEMDLLRDAESAKGNIFYWQIQVRRAEIRLKSAKNLLNFTQDTAKNLRDVYNTTIKSRQNISRWLAEKLSLKWMFDEETSGIEFERASFKVNIQKEGNYLVPVKFDLKVNGTRQQFNAVINFRAVNSSLSSIAKELVDMYGRIAEKSSRKQKERSVENEDNDFALSSLQKYHKLCSKFTNYERALHDMILPLFNLTSEAQELIKNSVKRNATNTFNRSEILENFNTSRAASFGLKIDKESYFNSLENDPIMSAAHELQNEALEDGFKPLHLNSKLLFKNWFSAMENVFNVVLANCSGFEDCIVFIIDDLFEMNEASGLPGSHKVRVMIKDLRSELERLIINTNISLNEANEVSNNILSILKDMRKVKLFCASAPNITKQPKPFTDIGKGRPLRLTCNATGDSLNYNWKFNEDYLPDQTTNTLYISKIMSIHSGNYSCVVTNHISMETSAPAIVTVHPAPSITIQPIKRLNAIVYTNDSLRCAAETTDNNMTYQWYFKAKISNAFTKLVGQRFSYLNFAPVKSYHEGLYRCSVSNLYGTSQSIISSVHVLNFSISVPVVKLTITLAQSRNNVKIFKRSDPDSIRYEDIQAKLAELLLLKINSNSNNGTSSSVNGTSSSVNGTSSSVNGTSSSVNGTSSSVNGTSSSVNGTSSSVNGTSSSVNGTSSSVNGTSSSVNGTSSSVNGTSSSVNGTSSSVNGTSSSVNGTSSSVNGTSSSSTEFNLQVKNLHVTDCETTTSSKICQWVFQYVNKNLTGNGQNFGQNAKKVIGSLQELRKAIGRLVQATNNELLAFNLGDQRFLVEKNSVGVEGVTTVCSRGRKLKENFRCVDCPPGYYGEINENEIASCAVCPVGTYQQNSGQTECTQCPEGFTTVQEESIYKTECEVICPAGTYGEIIENIGRCVDCPANTYQPITGQFSCLSCPNGFVTSSNGATDISQCQPEPTTTKRPTEKPTKKPTERPTEKPTEKPTKRPTEETPTKKRTTAENARTTEKESEVTTGESEIPSPGALTNSDTGSHTPAIGGAVGGFLFMCLLALALLYLVRKRRIARKPREPIDDKTVVVSNTGIELNSWNNPGFEDERDGLEETGQSENPMYVLNSASPVTTENPVYQTNPVHFGSSGFTEIKLDKDEDDTDLKVHGNQQNGKVIEDFGNLLYESNPARDSVNEPEESSGQYHEPVGSNSHNVTNFGNPLYEAFEKERVSKSSTLKLSNDEIVDEDV